MALGLFRYDKVDSAYLGSLPVCVIMPAPPHEQGGEYLPIGRGAIASYFVQRRRFLNHHARGTAYATVITHHLAVLPHGWNS